MFPKPPHDETTLVGDRRPSQRREVAAGSIRTVAWAFTSRMHENESRHVRSEATATGGEERNVHLGFCSMNTTEDLAPSVLARALENAGFESLWFGEHSHIPMSRKSPYPAYGPQSSLENPRVPL